MVSVRNFALFGTDLLGSLMLDKLHMPFNDLVLANAATTAIAVPLAFLLPAALVGRKDADRDIKRVETLGSYPEPETQPQGGAGVDTGRTAGDCRSEAVPMAAAPRPADLRS